jgi:hypothetical protein
VNCSRSRGARTNGIQEHLETSEFRATWPTALTAKLPIWFSVYLLQRGEVEAKMLRDAFPHIMDELFPNEGTRDRIHNLLEAQAYAVDYFMTLSEEERAAATNPTALESTSQWHLAFYLLVFNPDSPFVEPDEVPDGQQHALAACLEKASKEAQYAFTPMLQAINRFDAAKLPADTRFLIKPNHPVAVSRWALAANFAGQAPRRFVIPFG